MAFIGRMVRTCTVIGVALALSGVARADLKTNFMSVTPSGPNYVYRYSVDLSTESYIDGAGGPVDLNTVVDFWGYVPGSATIVFGNPANWNITEQNDGIDGIVQNPPDNGGVPNITFWYTGPYLANASTVVDLNVLQFTLESTENPADDDIMWYTSTSTDLNPVGEPQGNSGLVRGPRPGDVPEPGLLSLLLGSGVGGSLLALRRRIRK